MSHGTTANRVARAKAIAASQTHIRDLSLDSRKPPPPDTNNNTATSRQVPRPRESRSLSRRRAPTQSHSASPPRSRNKSSRSRSRSGSRSRKWSPIVRTKSLVTTPISIPPPTLRGASLKLRKGSLNGKTRSDSNIARIVIKTAARSIMPGGRFSPVGLVDHTTNDVAKTATVQRATNTTTTNSSRYTQLGTGPDSTDYLAYLAVQFDKDDNYAYSPGEAINGKIAITLNRRVLIAGLDFRLRGKVDVMLFSGKTSYRNSETFLYHCHRMIGSWDQNPTQLEPGTYISHFKYVLPSQLPSSTTKFSACQVRVVYGIQAILTDADNGRRQVNKMYLVRATPLKVVPESVYHTEDVDGYPVRYSLGSSNLIAGQHAIVNIETQLPITEVRAHLDQAVKTGPHEVSETLVRFKSNSHKINGDRHEHVIHLTVPRTALYDLTNYTKLFNLTQNLHVRIKYKSKWVKFVVPVQVFPSSSQYGDDIPKFERVKRYPTLQSKSNDEKKVKILVHHENESWLKQRFGHIFRIN